MIRRLTFIYITLSISFSALVKPIDDSTINYTHVLFEWEQINEAYSYQLQIATDSNFTNILTDINNESLIYIEKNNIDWNTQYYWRVRSLDGSDSPFGDWLISEFSTSQKRSNAEAITFNTSEVADGLTIFSSFFDYFSAVIDKNGDEIWNTGNNDLVYYINDNYGQLYGTKFDPNDSNLPGLKFSLDSEILWSETGESYVHHDIFQLPSQNYIGIAEKHQYGPIPEDIDYETLFLFEISGYPTYPSSDFFIFPWVGDEIIEWDEDGNIIWSWNTFDYLNWLEDYDLLGGVWDEGYDMGRFDWTHSNALWFDEQESTLLLSSRHLSRIIKIGYPSGDIIWQMGLDMPSGDIDCGQNLNFGFQHSLQVLDNGNILILDNGNISPQLYDTEYPTTRALEIAVTDTDNGCEAEIVWEYSLPENLFGFASGNAQKLDNGNYLITTVGGGATSLEIKPTGHNSGEIVWRGLYNLALPSGAAYRAHRIAGLYPIAFSVTQYPNNTSSFRLWNDGEIDETFNISFGNSIENYTIASGNYIDLDLASLENNITITPEHRSDLSKDFNFEFGPGDTNLDNAINILDLIVIVNHIIGNINLSNSQIVLSDFNNDGLVDILDVTSIINSLINN